MGKYAARHGVSAANDDGNPAFGHPEAPLLEAGIRQATELGLRLIPDYGINPVTDPVAVSTLVRSRETAQVAGFRDIREYSVLDEVKHGLSYEGFQQMKLTRILPLHVMKEAELTLLNPPEEKFWVVHGLRTTAICQILNIYQDDRLFQRHCEVRYLPIGD